MLEVMIFPRVCLPVELSFAYANEISVMFKSVQVIILCGFVPAVMPNQPFGIYSFIFVLTSKPRGG